MLSEQCFSWRVKAKYVYSSNNSLFIYFLYIHVDQCQLISRHWIVCYPSGKEESIDGPGVIGETPLFTPGHLHHYASCTRFVYEDYCIMEGHYTMRNLNKGAVICIVTFL